MSDTPTRMTGAQALIKALEMENVDTIFGLPGGAILPAYDPLLEMARSLAPHDQRAALGLLQELDQANPSGPWARELRQRILAN